MKQRYVRKRLHQHGGSKALDLPASFVRRLPSEFVKIEEKGDFLIIRSEDELTSMESDPLFALFIDSLMRDAMQNPAKLKDVSEVWDNEWDALLKEIPIDEE